MKGLNTLRLALAILICQLAGVIGAAFTTPSLPVWYASIAKPAFTPPGWLFAPVWIALFTLMGAALYLVWVEWIKGKNAKAALTVFNVQLAFNVMWSYLFFGLRQPFYAFVEIVALWISILLTIILFYRVSRKAALLLLPYFLWVSFAAALNYSIWQLNA